MAVTGQLPTQAPLHLASPSQLQAIFPALPLSAPDKEYSLRHQSDPQTNSPASLPSFLAFVNRHCWEYGIFIPMLNYYIRQRL